MKTKKLWTILAIAAVLAVSAAGQKSPEVALRGAMETETVKGDLKGAIEQYRKVAQSGNRVVAAQALVGMAECYQKLGDSESQNIYQRVVREYADQKEAVAAARAHLGGAAASASISSRRVWTLANAAGKPISSNFFGQVSADGRYLPYTAWGDEKGNLFVRDLVTGAERRLTRTADKDSYAEETAFSRDSKQLAYTWDTKEGVELRLISLGDDGIPQPRRLVINRELKWISPYSWSPDGRFIAVRIQRQDNSGQIGLVSAADGSLRVLKSTDWQLGTGVFFSPDGKYLAYDNAAGDSTGQRDIFVLAADGSHETPVVVHPANDTVLGWSSDGIHLLFQSDRGGSVSLWSIRINDGKPLGQPQLLRSDVGELVMFGNMTSGAQMLGISNSGALYFAVHNPGVDPSDIQVAGFDFSTGKPLSAPVSAAHTFLGSNVMPAWSPDGKQLAYASFRRTQVVIGIRSVETNQVREVIPSPNFSPGLVYFHSLTWAPDGNSFVVAAVGDKHGNAVFRIDAQTGSTSLLAPEEGPLTAAVAAIPSQDGKAVYILRFHMPDEYSISRHDLKTGEEKESFRGKGKYIPAFSRDGRFIGIKTTENASFSPARLIVIPLDGGAPRVIAALPNFGGMSFSPDDRYIATDTHDPATKSGSILLIPVEGGEIREIMKWSDPEAFPVWTWSPDSRSLLLNETSPGMQSVLWRVPIDGISPVKLGPNVIRNQGLRVSPDGKHVAFQTPLPAGTPMEIWVTENVLSALRTGK